MSTKFQPVHMNATAEDFLGNNGIGRYVLLPGSDGRAKEIAAHFSDVQVKEHSRGHNLYLGKIATENKKISVACISTGMGCPSAEIIIHELLRLGVKRFLRVGTAGSVQPDWIKTGSLINVQASVRDETTTLNYAPVEFPVLAALEWLYAIQQAATQLNFQKKLFTGIVHCKNSLYAREFGIGPRAEENLAYFEVLKRSGILASEMETAILFLLAQIANYQFMPANNDPARKILAGATLAIVSDSKHFNHSKSVDNAIADNILLALESIKQLASSELK